METPKDDSNLKKDQKATDKAKNGGKDSVLDSIKETKDEVIDSIAEKKEDLVSSIKETKDEVKESFQKKKEDISKSIGTGVKKTKSFFRKLLAWLIFIGLLCFAGYMVFANWTYSEGTRAGNLIKISKKGYIFKTYEGQLKLGGIDLENADEGLSDTWSFSVKDPSIIQKLERLQGQKVVLKYKQINDAMPWQGDTDYFIYEVME